MTSLGHAISARGVKPNPGKISVLTNMPMPTNVSELRSLIGGLSYCRIFFFRILHKSARPTSHLLKKGEKYIFTPEMEDTVRELLKTQASPPVLVFPDFDTAADGSRRFQFHCDSSNAGFDACLEQELLDSSIRPIVYFRRATFPNQRNWAPVEKEAECIMWAIKRLRQYLVLVPLDNLTDR